MSEVTESVCVTDTDRKRHLDRVLRSLDPKFVDSCIDMWFDVAHETISDASREMFEEVLYKAEKEGHLKRADTNRFHELVDDEYCEENTDRTQWLYHRCIDLMLCYLVDIPLPKDPDIDEVNTLPEEIVGKTKSEIVKIDHVLDKRHQEVEENIER